MIADPWGRKPLLERGAVRDERVVLPGRCRCGAGVVLVSVSIEAAFVWVDPTTGRPCMHRRRKAAS